MSFYMRSPVYTPNDPVKSVKQLHSWVYQLNENLKFMFSNLDSDNFTEDFSKNFSNESAEKTRSDIEKLQSAVEALCEKGQWSALSVIGLTPLEGENAPLVLNTGTCVFLAGGGLLTEALAGGGRVTIASLEEKNRPSVTQSRAVFAGGCMAEIEVLPSGAVVLGNAGASAIPAGAQVPVSICFGL